MIEHTLICSHKESLYGSKPCTEGDIIASFIPMNKRNGGEMSFTEQNSCGHSRNFCWKNDLVIPEESIDKSRVIV